LITIDIKFKEANKNLMSEIAYKEEEVNYYKMKSSQNRDTKDLNQN
jgi:hypothetical protein